VKTRREWSIVAILMLLGNGGCVFVRTAAPTILELEWSDGIETRNARFGMKDVVWSEPVGEYHIFGFGVHPREHETYAFFLNEPHPAVLRRYVHLASENGQRYEIRMVLNSSLYAPRPHMPPDEFIALTGTARLEMARRPGRRSVRLDGVTLHDAAEAKQVHVVSGRIAGRKASAGVMRSNRDEFERYWQRATSARGVVGEAGVAGPGH
jgi:hypothetical protein